jgi:hypothetical protein
VYFHVEISAGINHARVFNLNREDLLAEVLQPWRENRAIEMGDREWIPRDSSLRVLEGPQMEPPDLSFGQGWSNAERKAADVTRELLSETTAWTPDAFVVAAESPEGLAPEAVAGQGGSAIPWAEAKERIDRRDPEIAAVILVTRGP